MITCEEIQKIISEELLDSSEINNPHGINRENIDAYLIRPAKIELVNPLTNLLQEYWLILDEDPRSKEHGYLYDTFIDALNAM